VVQLPIAILLNQPAEEQSQLGGAVDDAAARGTLPATPCQVVTVSRGIGRLELLEAFEIGESLEVSY
jgi:hypothetical protein